MDIIKVTLRKIGFLIIIVLLGNSLLAKVPDTPFTFCNPRSIDIGEENATRPGEPVVVLYGDDYYIFVQSAERYCYSDKLRAWNLVYFDGHNKHDMAKHCFARIPVSARNKLLISDYSLAEARYPHKIPIGKFLNEAVKLLS